MQTPWKEGGREWVGGVGGGERGRRGRGRRERGNIEGMEEGKGLKLKEEEGGGVGGCEEVTRLQSLQQFEGSQVSMQAVQYSLYFSLKNKIVATYVYVRTCTCTYVCMYNLSIIFTMYKVFV